jgi:hypothetical protein
MQSRDFALTGILLAVFLIAASAPAVGLEVRAYQLKDDFGNEPLFDTAIQYYYYIPCPTYSWFWAFTGWTPGDIVGEWFQLGDIPTGGWQPGDPVNCGTLEILRILDFAGYGTVRPGIFTVEFEIYCSDEFGCPVGPSIWNSGPFETGFAWNHVWIDPPIEVCDCAPSPGSGPRFLVTATHTGSDGIYPAWGVDNISTPIEQGCPLHDYSCMPALYPRPYTGHYTSIHSGFYGHNFQYCPPRWFKDNGDPTPDGTQYGFTELCWRLYISCDGPSAREPSTWSNIKSMYR